MSKALIFSHVDADGILSARIAQLGLPNSKVYFQNWSSFGLTEENKDAFVKVAKDGEMDRFVGLDLGSDEATFNNLSALHDEAGIPCVWLDHHPIHPDLAKKYSDKDITIINQQGSCTSAMSYDMFSMNSADKYWQGFWAIIGIYGDVAQDGSRSKALLEKLQPNYPELFGKQIFWRPKKDGDSGGYVSTYEIPMMLCRYWNTVRRVTFHYGCPVGLRACGEIERARMPLVLMESFDEVMQARMPNAYILQKWQDIYQSERSAVFKADNMRFFDFGNFSVSVFKHRWDLGGYVAQIKAGDPMWRSHFAINMGLPDFIKVTGRNPGSGVGASKKPTSPPINLDLGGTLAELGVGGGHHQAASGTYPFGTPATKIIGDLCNVVSKRLAEKRETMLIVNETVQSEE